ncbi:MAG: pilus assembly protein FimV [Hydrogenophaga sp.]
MPSNPRHTPAQPTAFARKKLCFSGTIRLHAVAMAVVLGTGLAHTGDATALALGRIVVQSALGEPLRAEIEVPEITAEEASSLRVALATPAAFTAAGLQFNQALGSAQLTLQRRPDGRAYLRLSSPRPVNEPFVDLMIEASWASGRIVRDYTLLIDPPQTRAAAPVAPLPAATVPLPVRPPATASAQALPPALAPATRAPAAPAAAVASAAAERSSQVNVRAGDTAGRIAQANRPANVSLDQMLVAMLRTNPGAFIGDNVNRIKAGAVIDLPSESAASAVAAAEARQIIAAQSRDFDDFRRRLAGRVPTAAVDTGGREATGQVQAEVQEPKPAAPTQDKLTLSKGATPGTPSAEDKIAQERQANSASTRVAELARNVDELAKLGIPTPTADPGTPAPAAANGDASGATVTAPAAVPVPVPEETPPTAPALSEPDVVSPSAEPTAPAPAPVSAPTVEEPSLLDQLQENPLVLPAAAGLLVLLAGLGFYRMRQRKKNTAADSSFLESRLQPDSFFGSSGGQRIDTAESSASGSSMVYSPSQLDAAGDVDPVAEADVYLAYGRDLQAEEILKEAMRSTPTRVAIHNKLLEIYAKRRDAKAFEVVATEAYSLTEGHGPEWDHACALGRELDPNNPLYQPGGAPANQRAALGAVAAGGMLTQPFDDSALSRGDDIPAADRGLDLDLDFSTDDFPASLSHAPAGGAMSALDDLDITDALTKIPPVDLAALDSSPMDFDLDFPSEPAPLQSDQDRAPMPSPSASDQASRSMDFDLDFLSEPEPLPSEQARESMSSPPESDQPMLHLDDSLPDFSFDQPPTSPAAEPVAATEAQPDLDLPALASEPEQQRPFDLSEINFDFDTPASRASDDADLTEENPLDTKLSLAEEFRAIGDLEGARSLAEEVLAEASGALKTKADSFLAELG